MKRILFLLVILTAGVSGVFGTSGASASVRSGITGGSDISGGWFGASAASGASVRSGISDIPDAVSGATIPDDTPAPVSARGKRAAAILEKLAAEFRAMSSYEVAFGIVAKDYSASGSYAVEGESYCLTLGDAEVFADGATRYEVDNNRREVTVNEVDTASRNFLNNPVRAFDFLGSEYTPKLLREKDGQAVVRLTPTGGANAAAGEITVTVRTAPVRPVELAYDYDGEHITVVVTAVTPLARSLRHFDRTAYAGYEWIDFR